MSRDLDKDVLATVLTVVIALVSWVPMVLWQGWVGAKIWQWVMVEQFKLPSITVPQAVALMTAISFATMGKASHYDIVEINPNHKSTSDRVIAGIVHAVMTPAFALLIVWILKEWFL